MGCGAGKEGGVIAESGGFWKGIWVTKPHLLQFTIKLKRKSQFLLEEASFQGAPLAVSFGAWLYPVCG